MPTPRGKDGSSYTRKDNRPKGMDSAGGTNELLIGSTSLHKLSGAECPFYRGTDGMSGSEQELFEKQFCRWWGYKWLRKREDMLRQQLIAEIQRGTPMPTNISCSIPYKLTPSKFNTRSTSFSAKISSKLKKSAWFKRLNSEEKEKLQQRFATPCSSVDFNSCLCAKKVRCTSTMTVDNRRRPCKGNVGSWIMSRNSCYSTESCHCESMDSCDCWNPQYVTLKLNYVESEHSQKAAKHACTSVCSTHHAGAQHKCECSDETCQTFVAKCMDQDIQTLKCTGCCRGTQTVSVTTTEVGCCCNQEPDEVDKKLSPICCKCHKVKRRIECDQGTCPYKPNKCYCRRRRRCCECVCGDREPRPRRPCRSRSDSNLITICKKGHQCCGCRRKLVVETFVNNIPVTQGTPKEQEQPSQPTILKKHVDASTNADTVRITQSQKRPTIMRVMTETLEKSENQPLADKNLDDLIMNLHLPALSKKKVPKALGADEDIDPMNVCMDSAMEGSDDEHKRLMKAVFDAIDSGRCRTSLLQDTLQHDTSNFRKNFDSFMQRKRPGKSCVESFMNSRLGDSTFLTSSDYTPFDHLLAENHSGIKPAFGDIPPESKTSAFIRPETIRQSSYPKGVVGTANSTNKLASNKLNLSNRRFALIEAKNKLHHIQSTRRKFAENFKLVNYPPKHIFNTTSKINKIEEEPNQHAEENREENVIPWPFTRPSQITTEIPTFCEGSQFQEDPTSDWIFNENNPFSSILETNYPQRSTDDPNIFNPHCNKPLNFTKSKSYVSSESSNEPKRPKNSRTAKQTPRIVPKQQHRSKFHSRSTSDNLNKICSSHASSMATLAKSKTFPSLFDYSQSSLSTSPRNGKTSRTNKSPTLKTNIDDLVNLPMRSPRNTKQNSNGGFITKTGLFCVQLNTPARKNTNPFLNDIDSLSSRRESRHTLNAEVETVQKTPDVSQSAQMQTEPFWIHPNYTQTNFFPQDASTSVSRKDYVALAKHNRMLEKGGSGGGTIFSRICLGSKTRKDNNLVVDKIVRKQGGITKAKTKQISKSGR